MTQRMNPDEWARVYDDSNESAHAYVFRRSSEVSLAMVNTLCKPGERWIDLGCGPAHASSQLTSDGLVIGVDADERQLQVARNRSGALTLIAARVEQLPVGDNTIDGAIAISLMGCLSDPEACWAELARVLRPGGVAVMTFTNQASWLLRLNYLLPRRWITSDATGSKQQMFRLYDAAEIRAALDRHQFRLEHVSFYNNVLHAGRWLVPPRRLAPLVDRYESSRVGRNILIVARKTGAGGLEPPTS